MPVFGMLFLIFLNISIDKKRFIDYNIRVDNKRGNNMNTEIIDLIHKFQAHKAIKEDVKTFIKLYNNLDGYDMATAVRMLFGTTGCVKNRLVFDIDENYYEKYSNMDFETQLNSLINPINN
jgi:hypothetical protein